ncbi:signal transduction histidine kinase/CheY-like chemotaxis protein [Algoriphagus sp. 4150]|uniref:hybrid sensor histidine kinase/response regulator n=1 Tax=Algoriphagus sp. 4150 TaxID=2817756 RepID=UPI0028650E65|nr:ATP-binding protein [Algoriphagus sp. 4150]MDR7132278.1 signal transduction histidine kinase/CheY-like chemotaxis protein [Algoriphagus sp. 4150]
MQEREINNTFKKLVNESSEMVFLADDIFPYPIFFSNRSFEDQIGANLSDRSLVGLDLNLSDINFTEEIELRYGGNDYNFSIESPQDSSTNYFIFHKGKKNQRQDYSAKMEFQQFLIESPDAQLIIRPDGSVFLSNAEALKLFGYATDASINHLSELEELFQDPQQWRQWIGAAVSEPVTHRFSSTLSGFYPNQVYLEIASKQLLSDGLQYVMLSFQNISERVTLKKNLENSSNFLANLTEQVPGGLYQMVLDSEGKMGFSFLSKGIAQVLGLKPQDIESITDLTMAISQVHPLDLPQLVLSVVASARKLEPWQGQFRVKSEPNSDTYRWVLGAARPQALANGDMVWYGYLTDISEQKEFEATLDESRKVAEKANQIKSDFLSMISHELRTPLNAISASVYSLLHGEPLTHQKSELDTINFAVDNLIIMINDLLDFQKIEAGKLTIEKVPFNLSSFINQIIKGLSFHASDSKNRLEISLSEGLDITVFGDKTRLSQILNNLITNALKFTNEGEVKVTVNLLKNSNGKIQVYFEVCDNGIGIAPEHQERIFNDFDQVRPTFSSKYGGTGLGLSITRKLLNLMGGEISLQSSLNKGSRFFFELEFDIAEVKLKKPVANWNYSDQNSSLHLLMAEDNDVNALVLGKIINKWGFTYERVMNGLEAVNAVSNTNFDCILMDIQMPEMDGFDATMAIKKISEAPVIALTASAKLEIIDRIEECDFDGFVAKPIDASELQKIIKEVIFEKNQSD